MERKTRKILIEGVLILFAVSVSISIWGDRELAEAATTCVDDTLSASVNNSTKINATSICNAPSVSVVSPTQIDIRFERAGQPSPALCRNSYPVVYTSGVGWQLTACYTGTCETRTLQVAYEGSFWTGGLEDTDEGTGDGQPDYDIQISASIVHIPCCGDGSVDADELCDNIAPYNYKDDCGYGETNCCYTPAVGTSLMCTTYLGPHCGDGIPNGSEDCDDGNTVDGDGCNTYTSNCQHICGDGSLDEDEECESNGIWYGGTGLPIGSCTVTDPPGTCKYCNAADCTVQSVADGADVPLVVTGGLVALGQNQSDSAIELQRNIIFYSPIDGELYFGDSTEDFNNNMSPAEALYYDPRYLDIYRNILGDFGNIQFRESGVQ